MDFGKKIKRFILTETSGLLRRRKNISYYTRDELHHPGEYYSLAAFDYYKCIFVHIPKTAGVSVSKALFGNLSGGHHSIQWYKNYYGPLTFRRYFKFTFVRNPYSRLLSAYSYLNKGGMTPDDRYWSETNLHKFKSFEQFVIEWLTRDNIMTCLHFQPQTSFVRDEKGHVRLDFVGKFESLPRDFATVCQRLGVTASLGHENRSGMAGESWQKSYTPEMLRIVSEIYRCDLEQFGYQGA